MICRRAFLAGGLAAGAMRLAQAQSPPVVGYLGLSTPDGDRAALDALRSGLASLGREDGRNIVILARHAAGDMALAEEFMAEMVAARATVVVAPGQAATRALRRRTTLPVVSMGLPPSDPQLFASLARPGGTVTGFADFGDELAAKRIEVLKETIPGLSLIGVLHNGIDPTFKRWGEQARAQAENQGLRAVSLPLSTSAEAEVGALVGGLAAGGGQALVVVRDFLTSAVIAATAAAGMARGIAVCGEQTSWPEGGALMSYGPDFHDLFRRAALYVDRILKGEKAGDLPIQRPTKIEFVINQETARRLHLVLPTAIMLQADRVIE